MGWGWEEVGSLKSRKIPERNGYSLPVVVPTSEAQSIWWVLKRGSMHDANWAEFLGEWGEERAFRLQRDLRGPKASEQAVISERWNRAVGCGRDEPKYIGIKFPPFLWKVAFLVVKLQIETSKSRWSYISFIWVWGQRFLPETQMCLVFLSILRSNAEINTRQ